jgi:serine/threonine protein kinase
MLDSGSTLTVGQIVPDYELLRCIGRGAYGEVWLARSKFNFVAFRHLNASALTPDVQDSFKKAENS